MHSSVVFIQFRSLCTKCGCDTVLSAHGQHTSLGSCQIIVQIWWINNYKSESEECERVICSGAPSINTASPRTEHQTPHQHRIAQNWTSGSASTPYRLELNSRLRINTASSRTEHQAPHQHRIAQDWRSGSASIPHRPELNIRLRGSRPEDSKLP